MRYAVLLGSFSPMAPPGFLGCNTIFGIEAGQLQGSGGGTGGSFAPTSGTADSCLSQLPRR